MIWFFYLPISFLLILVQTTLLACLTSSGVLFDFILPVIIYLGLYRPITEGLAMVLINGFLMDAMTGGIFGMNITIYFWIYAALRVAIQYMHAGSIVIQPVVCGAVGIIQYLSFYSLIGLAGGSIRIHAASLTLQIIAIMISGPLLLNLIAALHARFDAYVEAMSSARGKNLE
jgi:hypothetical protein